MARGGRLRMIRGPRHDLIDTREAESLGLQMSARIVNE